MPDISPAVIRVRLEPKFSGDPHADRYYWRPAVILPYRKVKTAVASFDLAEAKTLGAMRDYRDEALGAARTFIKLHGAVIK